MSADVVALIRQVVDDTRQVALWSAKLSATLDKLQAVAGWTDAQLSEFMDDKPTDNPLLEQARKALS